MKSIAGVLLYSELLPILRELLWACCPDDLECHANLCTILLKVTALLFFTCSTGISCVFCWRELVDYNICG